MLEFEHAFWNGNPSVLLAGIDEAGRGPLAGPVFASSVLIRSEDADRLASGPLLGLTDSKKLTPKRRETFLEIMRSLPEIRIGIGFATAAEIDEINILRATHLAMRRSLLNLGDPLPAHALVDGLPVKGLPVPSTPIVKGDAKSLLIAAASIAAKVTRDHLMCEYDIKFPGYGFAKHKGYGTKAHMEALKRLGPCPIHRMTFAPVANVCSPTLGLKFTQS